MIIDDNPLVNVLSISVRHEIEQSVSALIKDTEEYFIDVLRIIGRANIHDND